jgi:hypothetical protein
MGAARIRTAGARDDDLMVSVVVIGAVVVHDDQQRAQTAKEGYDLKAARPGPGARQRSDRASADLP